MPQKAKQQCDGDAGGHASSFALLSLLLVLVPCHPAEGGGKTHHGTQHTTRKRLEIADENGSDRYIRSTRTLHLQELTIPLFSLFLTPPQPLLLHPPPVTHSHNEIALVAVSCLFCCYSLPLPPPPPVPPRRPQAEAGRPRRGPSLERGPAGRGASSPRLAAARAQPRPGGVPRHSPPHR